METEPPSMPPGPPPLPPGREYVTRNHAFAKTTTWSLWAGTLSIGTADQPVRRVPWSKVKTVRLEFAPTRPEPARFRCRLTLTNGEVLEFFNRTYRGVYDFADTSDAYGKFVQALHEELVGQGGKTQFWAGVSPGSYALNMAILGGLALVAVGALGFFLTVGLLWIGLIKLLLIAFYVPVAIRWARRNRPRVYDPEHIPPEVLPTG